jgi:hypothetical protein
MKLYLASLKKTESGIFGFLSPTGCKAPSSDMISKPWDVTEYHPNFEPFLIQLSLSGWQQKYSSPHKPSSYNLQNAWYSSGSWSWQYNKPGKQ